MQRKMFFRILLWISLLLAVGLGCEFFTNIRDGIRLVGTGRAVITDIGALTTQIIPAGIEETAMAMVTQIDESGMMETAQAAFTESAAGIGETAQAITTQVYTSPEEAPADIPVMEGETSGFIGTSQSVSYFIDADYRDVLDFYKREMPANGWQEVAGEGFSNDTMAEIQYQKGNRKASVVVTEVPFVGQTTVVITIQES